jgi:hemoglobin
MDQKSLFESIGGLAVLKKVHKIFYDKIYSDEWMCEFFKDIDQTIIENQQTDFMAQAMGGPNNYCGSFPIPAHQHIYITEELFDYRQKLLSMSLLEVGVSKDLADSWMKIDNAFRRSLIKKSVGDCKLRFNTDEIKNYPNPNAKKLVS